MTVNIPQKAGYVATVKEWDDLVRIAENLAAQVLQRDVALMHMRAELDAAHAEVARLKEEVEGAYEAHNEAATIFERRLETYKEAADDVLKALPAVAINEMEEIWGASNTALVRKALAHLWHCAARAALRQPAPAKALGDDGVCKCGHWRGQHRGDTVCMIFPCKCMEYKAPAQGQE